MSSRDLILSRIRASIGRGASLEDVFRHYSGASLGHHGEGTDRDVRSTRRTAGRVG